MQSNVLFYFLSHSITQTTIRTYARNSRKVFKLRSNKQIIKTPNPGMQRQVNLLNEKQNNHENVDQEGFEDLETDFMNVGSAHKLHEEEIEALKEKEKLLIVGRKYFKENKINFLTWADKEQIRHLHQNNPEEWTVDKLSEGFPALPNTIMKIIKNNWHPRTENRKANHDKQVENNWKLLKQGKMNDLPIELRKHVIKFSNRNYNIERNNKVTTKNDLNRTSGEFSSIIETYNSLVNEKNKTKENVEKDSENINSLSLRKMHVENSVINEQKTDQRILTLDQLKKDIERKIESNKDVNEYERMIIEETPQTNKLSVDTAKIGNIQTYKVELNTNLSVDIDQKVTRALSYPEKITIPKGKYKKGFTYKINDCYYDDDGEFLYRVPGMY